MVPGFSGLEVLTKKKSLLDICKPKRSEFDISSDNKIDVEVYPHKVSQWK